MLPSAERPYFGIYVARQVESLRRLGVEVRIEVVSGSRGAGDYLLARKRIGLGIKAYRPDVIHAHYGYTGAAVAFHGCPYILTLCGDDLNGESDGRGRVTLKSRLGVLLTQLLASAASRVLVMTEQMKAHLWKWARRKTEVLPYGIPDDQFTPGSQAAARRCLGLPDDELVLGFVNSGRQLTKRLDLAQASVSELQRRGRRVRLLVAERIDPSDMPVFYQASDCLLMTSELEGSPNSVREALACGVPVVSVAVGDVHQLIDTPEKGRVVSRSAAALAEGIEDVIHRSSRERVSLLNEECRSSSTDRRLLEIYQAVATAHVS